MKLTLAILLFLFAINTHAAIPVTANAGNDTTIYLTQSSSAILNGSGTGSSTPTYSWAKIYDAKPYSWLPDQTNNSTITSSTSAVTTVTGLEQGTWYYELSVTVDAVTKKDTVVIRVNYDVPPAGGTLLRHLPIAEIAPWANIRDDTTTYFDPVDPPPYKHIRYSDTDGYIYLQRGRTPGMMVDSSRGKFYSTVEDGYGGESNSNGRYARAELHFSSQYGIDTNKTYVYEWKGYFPQSILGNLAQRVPTDIYGNALIIMQWHGKDAFSPPFQFKVGRYDLNPAHAKITFLEWSGQGNGSDNETEVMPVTDDYVMKTHTIRVTLREGKGYSGQDAFIKVEVDGVQKYLRNTGQVGQTLMQDYIKFGSIYDSRRSFVDPNASPVNGRRFSLVTEAFNVFTIGTATTPVITWSNPAAITYGTALSSTQLNATTTVAGTFTYNYPVGTVLNAGTTTLLATFIPTDKVNYTSASKTVSIVVNKQLATLTASGMTVTYDGTQKSATVTTNPVGLTGVSKTYNGLGSSPVNAGSYTFAAGLSNTNYYATAISGTFVINKATATITVSNLNRTYTGSPLPVTVTTSPNVSGISVTYNGSATVPTNAGSYTVATSLTNSNYQATPVTTTLIINKATPTVSWSNPSAITYGTALSATQLNATASVAGSFVYTPASGVVLNAGTPILSVNFTPTDATNYNSVNNTTVSLVVNKATATISLSNLNQVYSGAGKSAIATTSPAGLNTITITYDGSGTLPVNAGTYAVSATLSNANYTATAATGNLVISKAVATLSLSGLNQNYNGSQRVVTVTSVPSGLGTITITYNGSSTAPTNAGSYPIIASLSNNNYQANNATGTLIVNKLTPTISWSNPSSITYGTALSGTQLNATSGGIAGVFTYTPTAGTVLNAGTRSLSVDFAPTDATNYNSVNGTTVSIVVNKATASLALSNLAQTFDGNPKPVTVTTSPVGLGVVSITYDGSATVPSAVGSYTVGAILTNSNYTATPASGTLVISNNAANIFITNYSNLVYTASSQTPTVTSAYSYSITYNGSGTAPTNVGSYTTIATINDGVHTGADTVTMTIIKATPIISWSDPSDITYGTALSGTQLNASTGVAGSFVYSPVSGTILNAGTQILSAAFTPTDAANYNSVPVTTASIIVVKASATLNVTNTSQVYDGTQKSVTVTTTPSGLTSIAVTYNGSTTPPSAVGTYEVISTLTNSNYTATSDTSTLTISATSAAISISNINQTYTGSALPVIVSTNPTGLTYTVTYNGSATVPINAGSYAVIATLTGGTFTGADTATLVINKSTPVVTWANPSDINYGTALSGTQLNASTPVAGTFVYSPASGTVLNEGTQVLTTVFTPTDAGNYNTVSKSVSITVTKESATLSLSNLNQVYDGALKPVTITSSPSDLDGISVTYNGSAAVPINAGSYAVIGSLTNSNYTASNVSGTLVINKASAILNYPIPSPIQQGTALTSAQFNATSDIAGTFTYNYAVGYVAQSNLTIIATFHPTDATNYNTQTVSTFLNVYGNPFLNFLIGTYYKNELPN